MFTAIFGAAAAVAVGFGLVSLWAMPAALVAGWAWDAAFGGDGFDGDDE